MADERVDRARERRRGARLRLPQPLPARVRAVTEAFVRDLSKGGALIETARALAPGSRCEVHLTLGELKANAMARVARCHLLAGGALYEAGLEFEKIDEATLAAIERIVSAASEGEPLPGTIETG